jgi:bacteriorhodopsin
MAQLLASPVLASVAPRIIIPGFFIFQKVKTMTDPALISQTIAFTTLFVASVISLFHGQPWLSIIPAIAAISYSYMLSDQENTDKYRYGDWFLTTPLMLTAILIANKQPWSLIGVLGFLDVEMIAAGYLGIQSKDDAKMLKWFIVGMLAFVPILYYLWIQKGTPTAVSLTLGLWCLYPIVYYLNEIKTLTPMTTTVSYSVMDVLAKVGLVWLLHY